MHKLDEILNLIDEFENAIEQLGLLRELGTSEDEITQDKKVKLSRKKLKNAVREAFEDLQENRKLRSAILSAYEMSNQAVVDHILLDALGEDYDT